ncbi:MAG: magnesium transporter [Dehalococcoidia bacterium]
MAEEDVVQGLTDDARALVENREWAKAIALLTALHPADLADIVLSLDDQGQRELLDQLPTDIAAQIFAFAEDDDELRELIRGVGFADLPAVLEEAEDDVAADVIQQLEPEEQAETLRALDRGEEVAELLQYEEESAGGLMTRGFVALHEGATVQDAIDYLRLVQPAADRAYYVYVLDYDDRLQGVVSIRDLIVSAPGTRLDEITQRDFHAVTTGTDQEAAARILQRYNLLALPVVDGEGRLEGVMGADDLIDVLEEEATEDMYRMVGLVEEGEKVFSPVRQSVRRRLPWMMINLATAALASLVVSLFDATLAKATVLAAFMPMVAGQGGNAGTQTATIAVRSMALGDLYVRDIFRAARKETLVGIANGIAVGIAGGLLSYFWEQNVALSIVLGTALFLNIVAATLGGVLIPLGLKSMKVDPALAANIFVTTVTDVMGFLFFLGLASLAIDQIA